MPAITNAKYSALLDIGNCEMEIILPDGRVLGLSEQNGGLSTLFDREGNEIMEVEYDGTVYDEDGERLCSFDDLTVTGDLAPWCVRIVGGPDDGEIHDTPELRPGYVERDGNVYRVASS